MYYKYILKYYLPFTSSYVSNNCYLFAIPVKVVLFKTNSAYEFSNVVYYCNNLEISQPANSDEISS